MRILYLTGQLALHGGIERVTILKLNYLSRTDNEVFLSTYEQGGKPFIYSVSEKVHYVDIGINYNVDYTRESLYSWRCLKLVGKHFVRTRQLLKRIKPDVIIIPNLGYEYWFLPLLKGNAVLIREYHDSQYNRTRRGLKTKIDDFVQQFYDGIVVLTPQEIDYFKFKKNIFVIPNPIASPQFISNLSCKKIISVGRIDRVKRFEFLIDIADLVLRKHPDWVFEVYGEGNRGYENELKKKLRYKNIEYGFFFMGKTSEVQKKMSEASIYVCTSKTESFGLTLVEAMAAGLPVVSFDCPNGPRNIIHNGVDGYLIQNDSIEKAAAAIIKVIEDKNLLNRMGYYAKDNAKNFYLENIMNIWMELFVKLKKYEI